MPVLPKFQLKQLFEAGDLITQTTLDELIEATYNPNIIAGNNITINKVTTPSGTDITISASGGGGGTVQSAINLGSGQGVFAQLVGSELQFKSLKAGSNVSLTSTATEITISSTGGGVNFQAGDGLAFDTSTSPDTLNVDLYTAGCVATHGANLEFVSNQLNFKGVHVQDEGTAVGTFPVLNFTGVDVLSQASGSDSCVVDIFIPPPTFLPYFNQAASTECNCTTPFSTPRISKPTTEGTPFKTGGGSNALWAATNNKASYEDSGDGNLSFTMVGPCTGFGGDSTIKVDVFDADGVTILETFTTPAITGNNNHVSPSGNIIVFITNYGPDSTKFKAQAAFAVKGGSVLTAGGYQGGRFHVKFTHTTDTGTDTGSQYFYYGPNGNTIPTSQSYNANAQDVFFDINNFSGGNPSTPVINGTTSIAENPAALVTKHISGVEYYDGGSQFMVDVTDIDKFNANTQGRQGGTSYNFRAEGVDYNLPVQQIQAWGDSNFSGTNWPDFWNTEDVAWDYDNWAITSGSGSGGSATGYWRFRNNDATVNAKVYDPWNTGNTVSSSGASILIDTFGTRSTNLSEPFTDEAQRLYRDTATSAYISWDSGKSLADGTQAPNATGSAGTFENGCIVGSRLLRGSQFFSDDGNSPNPTDLIPDLTTYKPNNVGVDPNPNYTTLTNIAVYHRKFFTSSSKNISNVILSFTGDFGTTNNATNALANSDMKIYIRRDSTNSVGSTGFNANPLAVHGGLFDSGAPANPWNDGASGVDTPGSLVRQGSSSGNNVEFTFGLATQLCKVGFWMEIQLVSNQIKLDQVNVTLKFSDGTSESNVALTPN